MSCGTMIGRDGCRWRLLLWLHSDTLSDLSFDVWHVRLLTYAVNVAPLHNMLTASGRIMAKAVRPHGPRIRASKEVSVCVPGNCHNKIISAQCSARESGCTNVHSCMSLIQADSAWYETLAGGCCPYSWHMYCMTRRVKSMFSIKNWHV